MVDAFVINVVRLLPITLTKESIDWEIALLRRMLLNEFDQD